MASIADVITSVPALTWDDVLAPHIYVFYAAFLISFIFTPVMRSIATYYGIIDQPDNLRKMHTSPVAYLGGIAVFLGWVAGLAISQLHLAGSDVASPHLRIKISIVAGAAAVLLLGLWDDIKHIRPTLKLVGQGAGALLLISQGVGTHLLTPVVNPILLRFHNALGIDITVPPEVTDMASRLLVICIVVACCNATNLMDGLDGLCGGVTAVIAAGFLFLAVHIATMQLNFDLDALRIVLALALLGAVLGFVPFNFNPASIFMGDAGSMFLGYACATMIVVLAQEQSKWFLAAIIMFALPIMDTALAFARRYVNRRPLFSADRHHFHHQLVARGLSVRKTVVISYCLAIGFCVLGAFIVYMRTRYALAIYLVIFGSIIVAAYKMGMVHEKPRVVPRLSLEDTNAEVLTPIEYEPDAVLEIQDPRPAVVVPVSK